MAYMTNVLFIAYAAGGNMTLGFFDNCDADAMATAFLRRGWTVSMYNMFAPVTPQVCAQVRACLLDGRSEDYALQVFPVERREHRDNRKNRGK